MTVKIDREKCLGCRICVSSCPLGLLETDESYKIVVAAGCNECGSCLNICPYGYISLE